MNRTPNQSWTIVKKKKIRTIQEGEKFCKLCREEEKLILMFPNLGSLSNKRAEIMGYIYAQ